MQKKRIQNRISESRWTLPIVVSTAFIVWLIAALHTRNVVISGGTALLSTYLMVELNNANALIRIYSRMVSCAFAVMATMPVFLFPSHQMAFVMLGFVGFYTLAFRSYQDIQSPGHTFYAFLCIGAASIEWVQVLFFLPFLWLIMRVNLLSMSLRNFVASLLGIILPYWFYTAYLAMRGDLMTFIDHFCELAVFSKPFDLTILTPNRIILLVYVLLCGLIGIIHFLDQKRSDSIRTRLFYQVFINIFLIATAFLFLQPQHYDALIGVLIVATAPLIAHFFALTHGRITNWMFKILSVSAILITLYNLWIFLHTSF